MDWHFSALIVQLFEVGLYAFFVNTINYVYKYRD